MCNASLIKQKTAKWQDDSRRMGKACSGAYSVGIINLVIFFKLLYLTQILYKIFHGSLLYVHCLCTGKECHIWDADT